jgi:4-aminobutyrate aminotransferase-like enzyme
MQYLWDADGRRYVDAYNNALMGHCHPHVVQAGQAQMGILNTNTRYLHELVHQYAARSGATLPGTLKVCYFVIPERGQRACAAPRPAHRPARSDRA